MHIQESLDSEVQEWELEWIDDVVEREWMESMMSDEEVMRIQGALQSLVDELVAEGIQSYDVSADTIRSLALLHHLDAEQALRDALTN